METISKLDQDAVWTFFFSKLNWKVTKPVKYNNFEKLFIKVSLLLGNSGLLQLNPSI